MQNPENQNTPALHYDGRLGEVYKIFLLNVVLSIFTLGIYHFWGKTRLRRYVTSSFIVEQDRFEYTGYGSELFWGFVKALIILALIIAPFYWFYHKNAATFQRIDNKISEAAERREKSDQEAEEKFLKQLEALKAQKANPSDNQKEIDLSIPEQKTSVFDDIIEVLTPEEKKTYMKMWAGVGIYSFIYFIYLPFVAVYGSLRYRATRTRWRGIRGHLGGSSLVYGLVGVFHLLLKWITLGIWIPFGDAKVWKYKMKRLSFGNQLGKFTPQYRTLFLSHIKTILCAFLLALVCTPVIAKIVGAAFGVEETGTDPLASHLGTMALLACIEAIPLFLVLLIITRQWYQATLLRIKYNGLIFGNIGFKCTISGWGLLKQRSGNLLILLFTLGLGVPIVTQRRQRFFIKHMQIMGNIERSPILQATGEKDKWGEGLSSVFDLDVGFF